MKDTSGLSTDSKGCLPPLLRSVFCNNLCVESSCWVMAIEMEIKDRVVVLTDELLLMLDPLSWLELLIRAGGSKGWTMMEKEQRGKASVASMCWDATMRLYHSWSNRRLKHILPPCFTLRTRSDGLYLRFVADWLGADETESSSLRAGARVTMLTVYR